MFDDLELALRYDSVVYFSFCLMARAIPVPITQDIVDELKRDGWWAYVADRLGPYVANGAPE